MHTFFILLTGLTLMQVTVSKADDRDFDLDDAEFSESLTARDSVRAAGWNRWTCIATRPFDIRMYRGSSYYFRAQSGEGQDAKLVAQKIAVRACEFASNGNCTSTPNRCTVERH